MDWIRLAREFITIFVVIDPVGSIPVFLFAVSRVPASLHRRFAIRAVAIAGIVLLGFLAGGQFLLETLGLGLGSFQIAGGIILFLFALTMIFGEAKSEREIEEAERDHLAGAVFPLAMPSIASPGAMLAVVVLTDNHSQSVAAQVLTAGLLVIVLLITLCLLLAATLIHRIIGNTGASVISRVMGIVLATIAVDAILGGFDTLGILDIPTASEAEIQQDETMAR
jgi:multiple antibiotic resistance protein